MEQQNTRLRNAGFATFFFSGICAISAGVVVSLLQERYGFAYGMTGTLLSLMSVGNLLAGLLMGMLPSALGMKRSVLLLTIGYAVGYAVMGLTGAVALLAVAFFVVGIAKGSVINTCTILVSDHSADRTRGMNLMHSCYACGALLCPFLIAAAARVSTELAVFLLAVVGLVLWLVYVFTPLRGGKSKSSAEKEAIDWSFLRSARFWLLTGLLFFQNAAEQSVNGWMVTYFKGSGIIAGTLAAYTVTVMWGATLVGRLLIAFVFPLKNPRKAMVGMSVLCTVFYVLLVMAHTQGAAIALLFAIQNLKPSPFCLLDEIEAALDDSNVGRFAGYLHKLTKHTQFIVITHRRGTMEKADRLYGITMQEKGVSTLVSVSLIDKELTN